jgi:hypothetical protein
MPALERGAFVFVFRVCDVWIESRSSTVETQRCGSRKEIVAEFTLTISRHFGMFINVGKSR